MGISARGYGWPLLRTHAVTVQCPECHAESEDHNLRKATEMAFMCKKVCLLSSNINIWIILFDLESWILWEQVFDRND